MFPIRDHNPSRRLPFVTYGLIALNVLIFLGYYPLFSQPDALARFFATWGVVPARLSSGGGELTVLSSMFLHGGIMHLLGNMLFLFVFGDNIEDALGHMGYLALYLVSGIGAATAQYLADPASPVPMVGASGAIAGVMGGYLLLYPKAQVDVLIIFVVFIRIIPVPAWVVLGAWFALQVFSGAATPTGVGGVAYWAHAGGFSVGLIWTFWIWLRLGGPAFWRQHQGHPPHAETRYRTVRSNVPRIRR